MACPRTMSTLAEAPPKSTWPLFEAGGDFEYHLEVSYEEEADDDEEERRDDRYDSDDLFNDNLTDIELLGSTESLTSAMERRVNMDDVNALMRHFSREHYRSKTGAAMDVEALHKCLDLFSKDYHYFLINNDGGKITATYPDKIVVLEYEKTSPPGKLPEASAASPPVRLPEASMSQSSRLLETSTSQAGRLPYSLASQPTGSDKEEDSLYESMYDIKKLQFICGEARMARCRKRFPVPTILLEGKNICRSATISGGYELIGRTSLNFIFPDNLSNLGASNYEDNDWEDAAESETTNAETSTSWTSDSRALFDKVRANDIRVLKKLGVACIFDLMVEKKKIKYTVPVTSSEKVDKENRYRDFKLLGIPYPGCEFFKEFSSKQYCAIGLMYDWELPFVDAVLDVPEAEWSSNLGVTWEQYKQWDLVALTRNYLKLILSYLTANEGGILIHCISGWDRTPLYISLLRMSLWADGLIHKSLSAVELLYLTIGYDWFLFSHDLPNRMKNGEEIMYFCFDFLKYITGQDYSIVKRRRSNNANGEAVYGLELGTRERDNSSLNSSSCSLDKYPMVFQVLTEEELHRPPAQLSPAQSSPDKSSPDTSSVETQSPPRAEAAAPAQSRPITVPVPVPRRPVKRPDSALSLTAGSWQIMTGTGSVRGSTLARDSLSSPPSLPGSHNRRLSSDSDGERPPSASAGPRQSLRSRRLDELRTHFFAAYTRVAQHRFNNGGAGVEGTSHFSRVLVNLSKLGSRSRPP